MKFDVQRAADEKRFELEKMRREIEAYDDAVQREARKGKGRRGKARKQAKVRKEVDQHLENKAARKANPLPKSNSQKLADIEGYAGGGEVKGCGSAVRGTKFKGVF
tara:strand:- start:1012 stop:1329 length:318 start_codon:yes stop_codon:yes gene_type:complete